MFALFFTIEPDPCPTRWCKYAKTLLLTYSLCTLHTETYSWKKWSQQRIVLSISE